MISLTNAIQLAGPNASAFMQRVYSHAVAGNFEKALEDADRAVELDPKDPLAVWYRAKVKVEKGDGDGALSDFNAALAIVDIAAIRLDRGMFHLKHGRPDLAKADFDAAIELSPTLKRKIDDDVAKERGENELLPALP